MLCKRQGERVDADGPEPNRRLLTVDHVAIETSNARVANFGTLLQLR